MGIILIPLIRVLKLNFRWVRMRLCRNTNTVNNVLVMLIWFIIHSHTWTNERTVQEHHNNCAWCRKISHKIADFSSWWRKSSPVMAGAVETTLVRTPAAGQLESAWRIKGVEISNLAHPAKEWSKSVRTGPFMVETSLPVSRMGMWIPQGNVPQLGTRTSHT